MVIIATLVVGNAEALHLGIYEQIYHEYVGGYEINELADLPSARRYQKWDGEEWVIRGTTLYDYDLDDRGRVIRLEEHSSDTAGEFRTIYEYAYDGATISEVRWQQVTQEKGEEVIDSGRLEISRSPTRIVETDYTNGKLRSETTYELDNRGRIVHVELIQWNPFVNEMRTSFERSITYVSRDSNRIATIELDGADDRPVLVEEFTFRGNIVEITYGDGRRQELEYEGDRLVRSTDITPRGQFAGITRFFDYDGAGRLMYRTTLRHHDVDDTSLEPSLEDIRIEFVYE